MAVTFASAKAHGAGDERRCDALLTCSVRNAQWSKCCLPNRAMSDSVRRFLGSSSSMDRAAIIPAAARVFIGVLSFAANKHSLERRKAIRSLSSPCACAALRFVMAAGENATDWEVGDVLQLPIRKRSSFTGKYLLQNALLRFGAKLNVDWVMRMDDDTLLNVSHWSFRLMSMSTSGPRILLAEFKSWYMWHEETRMAVCHAYNLGRWRSAPSHWSHTDRWSNLTTQRVHECRRNGTYGPFLFPNGPAAAFSRTVAHELVALIDERAEEDAVLNRSLVPMVLDAAPSHLFLCCIGHSSIPIYPVAQPISLPTLQVNPYRDVVYPPHHSMHPGRKMFEDVYLGFLLHQLYGNPPRGWGANSARAAFKLVRTPPCKLVRTPPWLIVIHQSINQSINHTISAAYILVH